MGNTSQFNQNGHEATDVHVLSRGARALRLVRDSYDLHGSSEATFALLQSALKLEPLDRLKLCEPLQAIMDVLRTPDDAKKVRIERPAPPVPYHRFDADSSFNSETQRGGDPSLAKILNGLNGLHSPLPDSPAVPKYEYEVQRKIDAHEHFQTQTSDMLSAGRDAVYREVLKAALHENRGYSIQSNHAFHQVAENIKGGKEACERIASVTRALSIFAHHEKGGLSLAESASVAEKYVMGEKRLALTKGL